MLENIGTMAKGTKHRFRKNQTYDLYLEKEPRLYVVETGAFLVCSSQSLSPGLHNVDECIPVAMFEEGNHFGLGGLTAYTTPTLECIVCGIITSYALNEIFFLLNKNEIFEAVAEELRHQIRRAEIVTQKKSAMKMALFLHQKCKEISKKTGGCCGAIVPIPHKHVLARILGITPEHLSRLIKQFSQSGNFEDLDTAFKVSNSQKLLDWANCL